MLPDSAIALPHKNSSPSLDLGLFTLDLEFPEPARLPVYLGAVLHPALGRAARKTVCLYPDRPECPGCPLFSTCVFPRLFGTAPHPGDNSEVRPYVLRIPPYFFGEPTLTVGFTLIGKGYLSPRELVTTFEEMGRFGLGPGRVPFRLLRVTQEFPEPVSIYDGKTGLLRPTAVKFFTAGDLSTAASGLPARSCHLEFLTPLRLVRHGKVVQAEKIDFGQVIDFLLRRLDTLDKTYGSGMGLSPEAMRLREQARDVQTVSRTLRWRDGWRDRRGRSPMPMGGWVGRLTCEGALTPFLPYLILGQWLHLGTLTSFGFGQYRYDNW